MSYSQNDSTLENLKESPSGAALQLTKYPVGSIKEIWTLSYPLMLSALSGTLMIFFDRLILARFQTQAMNAAANAGMIFFTWLFVAIGIAGIAEVLVGQYNGARDYKKIGKPVWAMIWFSCMLTLPYWAIGIWGSPYLIPDTMAFHGVPYLRCLMLFSPMFPLVAALSAFFIGRGKVMIVTLTVAGGNILNLVLDVVLVFGVPGLIPEMGSIGAAIGTGIAQTSIAVVLFALFLKKKHREAYGTNQWRIDWGAFKACLKIGLPNSIGHLASISAWTLVMYMLSDKSFEHITVFTIAQSLWILFSFVTDGTQKAVATVASNFIGAKQMKMIKPMLKSALMLQGLYALAFLVPLVVVPGLIIDQFLPKDLSIEVYESMVMALELGLIWMSFALLCDAIMLVIAGVLTAAGDTLFIMAANGLGSWLFGLLPMYTIVVSRESAASTSLILLTFNTMIMAGVFFARYKSNVWQKKANLIKN